VLVQLRDEIIADGEGFNVPEANTKAMMYLTNPVTGYLRSTRDRPVTREAGYFPPFSAFFFFAVPFRGCGGALKMRRSASSNGTGVRSGLGGSAFFAFMQRV